MADTSRGEDRIIGKEEIKQRVKEWCCEYVEISTETGSHVITLIQAAISLYQPKVWRICDRFFT